MCSPLDFRQREMISREDDSAPWPASTWLQRMYNSTYTPKEIERDGKEFMTQWKDESCCSQVLYMHVHMMSWPCILNGMVQCVRCSTFLQFIIDVLGNSMQLEMMQHTKQHLPAAFYLRVTFGPCFQTQKTFSLCTVLSLHQAVRFCTNTQSVGNFVPLWSNASCVEWQHDCWRTRTIGRRHCKGTGRKYSQLISKSIGWKLIYMHLSIVFDYICIEEWLRYCITVLYYTVWSVYEIGRTSIPCGLDVHIFNICTDSQILHCLNSN